MTFDEFLGLLERGGFRHLDIGRNRFMNMAYVYGTANERRRVCAFLKEHGHDELVAVEDDQEGHYGRTCVAVGLGS